MQPDSTLRGSLAAHLLQSIILWYDIEESHVEASSILQAIGEISNWSYRSNRRNTL